MKKIVIPALLLAAAFFLYPLVNEGDGSPCAALEKRALTLAARDGGPESVVIASIARELLKAGNGKLAREFARQRNPDVPVQLSCTVHYWHSVFDRNWLTDALSREFR